MNKQDLSTGMHVILRNRCKYVVQKKYKILVDIEDGTYIELDDIKYDLNHIDNTRDLDIMKIYDWQHNLLWQRKEKPKLTEDEKVILRNIPEKWKCIARDKDSNGLFVFENKPKKSDVCWKTNNPGESRGLNLYKHLFQFIKWKDEEPYLISDLLGGENNEN